MDDEKTPRRGRPRKAQQPGPEYTRPGYTRAAAEDRGDDSAIPLYRRPALEDLPGGMTAYWDHQDRAPRRAAAARAAALDHDAIERAHDAYIKEREKHGKALRRAIERARQAITNINAQHATRMAVIRAQWLAATLSEDAIDAAQDAAEVHKERARAAAEKRSRRNAWRRENYARKKAAKTRKNARTKPGDCAL